MAAAPVKKILIADDEPDILEIVGYNLQKEGYEVHTAKNGDEAVDLAKKIKPDLLILDIMMPKKRVSRFVKYYAHKQYLKKYSLFF